MAKRVVTGRVTREGPRLLKAKQIITINHPDIIGDGLMMIDSKGEIYAKGVDGWIPFTMEVSHESV